MAMNTWACNQYGGVRFVGLCHGVFHGAHQIAKVLGIPEKELDYICAGINHQTWFIRLRHKGRDLSGKLLAAFEKDPVESRREKVRIDMLRRFGCYSTESNGHLSEYLAWYRKRPSDLKNWIDLERWQGGETCGVLRVLNQRRDDFDRDFPKLLKQEYWPYLPDRRSPEHGSYLIESLETGRVYRGHFNMPNRGLITNLPQDAMVEVPGYVDGNGINMPVVGDLPLGCAAVCNASISVQRLSVEAAVHGDIDLLRQAMMMDPLMGAVCNPPEIWRMADEMLVAQARWLPQYKKETAKAARRLAKMPRVAPKPRTR
jgi:alpha-galactosidase